jgi:hypothetical protein
MERQIYILMHNPSPYSDEESQVIGAFSTEDKAVDYLVALGVDLSDAGEGGEFDILERQINPSPGDVE